MYYHGQRTTTIRQTETFIRYSLPDPPRRFDFFLGCFHTTFFVLSGSFEYYYILCNNYLLADSKYQNFMVEYDTLTTLLSHFCLFDWTTPTHPLWRPILCLCRRGDKVEDSDGEIKPAGQIDLDGRHCRPL